MKKLFLLFRIINYNKLLFFVVILFILFVALYTLVIPLFFKILIDYIIINEIPYFLTIFACIIIAIIAARIFYGFFQDFLFMLVRQKMENKAISAYFKEMLSLSLDHFQTLKAGDLISRLTSLFNSFQYFFVYLSFYIFFAIFISIVICTIFFFLNKLLFIGTIIFLTLHIINIVFFSRIIGKTSQSYFAQRAKTATFIGQFMDGYVDILTSWQQPFFIQKFNSLIVTQYGSMYKKELLAKIQEFLQNILISGNLLFILFAGSSYVMQNSITLGSLMLYMLLLHFLYDPIYMIHELNKMLQDTIAQLVQIYSIIDNPHKEVLTSSKKRAHPLEQIDSVELRNVSFSFVNDKPLFSKFSCAFHKDRIYCIMGKSGAGKTTLFKLLIGIYHPDYGSLLYNNKEYTAYNLHDIRRRISYATQENYCFRGTIQNNITNFALNINKENLEQAIKTSQADSFIYNLANQLYSTVEEGGKNMSGGQSQRICLARLLYEIDQHDILLLDEPTAGLDEHNEKRFMQQLQDLKKDKIIIIISHNNAIVEYCDEIITIDTK